MNSKNKFFSLFVMASVLASALVLAGCENPAGPEGPGGLSSPNVCATWEGVFDAYADGYDIVYLVGDVSATTAIIPSSKTLIVASQSDLAARAMGGNSVGKLTVPEGVTLTVGLGATLKVAKGASIDVPTGGAIAGSGDLVLDFGSTSTLTGTVSATKKGSALLIGTWDGAEYYGSADGYTISGTSISYDAWGEETDYDWAGTISYVNVFDSNSGCIIVKMTTVNDTGYTPNYYYGNYYKDLSTLSMSSGLSIPVAGSGLTNGFASLEAAKAAYTEANSATDKYMQFWGPYTK